MGAWAELDAYSRRKRGGGWVCIISTPTLIRLLRNHWTQDGWAEPLEDQEDPGPDADPWDAYGLFDEFDDFFRGD